MVQWSMNLTSAARIEAEAQVQSPAGCSGFEGSSVAAAEAWIQSLARLHPWPFKKKKKKHNQNGKIKNIKGLPRHHLPPPLLFLLISLKVARV